MNRFCVAMLMTVILAGCGGKFGLSGAEAKEMKELDCHNTAYLRSHSPLSSHFQPWGEAFPEKYKRMSELERKVDAWEDTQPDSSKAEKSDEIFAWRMKSICKG